MPLPRFRLRTLMIAVAVVGISLAILVTSWERRRRARETVFRFTNATAAPVDFARVTHSGGVVKIEPLMPGKAVEWRTHVSLPEYIVVQHSKDGGFIVHSATPSGGETDITFVPGDQRDPFSCRTGVRYSYLDVPVR